MKTTTLFRSLWRVNAIIIFGAGALMFVLGSILAYQFLEDVTRDRSVDAVVNTDTQQNIEQSFGLGTVSRIEGHPWLLVPLESDQHYDQVYFSKDATAARNYAFMSGSLETRWLYPHSRFLIVEANQVSRGDYGESAPTVFVSFEVVQQDTNGDRRLTPEDSPSLVFTRPDGTGTTMALENIRKVVSLELLDEEIVVIFEDRDGYAAATFSLKDFSSVKRERLALPPVGS